MGEFPERSKGADCKSVDWRLRRFESYTPHCNGSKIVMMKKRLIVVSIVAAGLLCAPLLIVWGLNRPIDRHANERSFTVRHGEPLATIAAHLEDRAFIRSALLLRFVSRTRESGGQFQSGVYRISSAMSTVDIHNLLIDGSQLLQAVTIPEGWSLQKIARRLERLDITDADRFITAAADPELLRRYGIPGDSAEGFLYPETYFFPHDFPADRVVMHMLDTFFEQLAEIDPHYLELSQDELYDRVIMASIIEREYVTADEAATIASVFYNRLNARMRLESCATVVYVMTEQEGLPHPGRLFYHDLDRDSDYNTYRNWGLPPGPISNPSGIALDAAFHPAETNYHFFVLKGYDASRHHFSEDLVEHYRASVYYLKNP